MRIVWLVTAVLLALAGLARAEEMPDWSRPSVGEIAALAAMEGLIAIDAAQTVRAHNRMHDFVEANPLLGRHPSTERIVISSVVGGVAAGGLWYWLPPKVRFLVPAVVGVAEIVVVTNNARSFGLISTRF